MPQMASECGRFQLHLVDAARKPVRFNKKVCYRNPQSEKNLPLFRRQNPWMTLFEVGICSHHNPKRQ
jgi:hypothetical protein